jgi:hypothetical protein
MDRTHCANCGAELDEASTLLPDQRLPCPTCGSLTRRFDETGRLVLVTVRAASFDAILQAPTATASASALDATVRTESRSITDPSGRPHVTDQLVVMGRHLEWIPLTGRLPGMSRSLWWVQLSEQPTWLVQVVDEDGELIDSGVELESDQMVALAGLAKNLPPSAAGPMLLTVRDQAGEVLAISTTDNPVKTLAAVTDSLLPRHPG